MRALPFLALLALALPAPAIAAASQPPAAPASTDFATWTAGLDPKQPAGPLVGALGRRLMGTPYLTHPLGSGDTAEEPVSCRLDGFDCVTFVETVLAGAEALRAGTGAAGFREALGRYRYRPGEVGRYAGRHHYFSDFLSFNAARGALAEQATAWGGVPDSRPIDFMTTHRASYPGLVRGDAFEAVAAREAAISRAPRPYIPAQAVAGIEDRIREGDVIAFETTIPGLDVVHVGVAVRCPDGRAHLLHAPEPGSTVQMSAKPLGEQVLAYKAYAGLRIFRPS